MAPPDGVRQLFWTWRRRGNVTAAERAASHPCDSYLTAPWRGLLRAVDIDAHPDIVFRWLCQLKIAPYSYDLLDNGGRRSPRQLTPGADELAVGQPFLVFQITDFEPGSHISGTGRQPFVRIFGPLAGTYIVTPRGANGSRLVVKQLLTLKDVDAPRGTLAGG